MRLPVMLWWLSLATSESALAPAQAPTTGRPPVPVLAVPYFRAGALVDSDPRIDSALAYSQGLALAAAGEPSFVRATPVRAYRLTRFGPRDTVRMVRVATRQGGYVLVRKLTISDPSDASRRHVVFADSVRLPRDAIARLDDVFAATDLRVQPRIDSTLVLQVDGGHALIEVVDRAHTWVFWYAERGALVGPLANLERAVDELAARFSTHSPTRLRGP